MNLNLNLNKEGKIYSLKSTIQIGGDGQNGERSGGGDLGSEITPDYDESIQLNVGGFNIKGTWGVYYGCDDVLDKPVIVIEGFDPLNTKRLDKNNGLFFSNLYSVNDTKQNILDKLMEVGYDIVILDFEDNPIGLTFSGRLVAELIETINNRKVGNHELIVMGRSGGGLLARYALAYLESIGVDHQTRMLLTIDSPHQGANIQLGFQHFLDYIANTPTVKATLGLAAIIMSNDLLSLTINSVYAQQLLYYHHSATSNNAYPSPLKNNFFSNLKSLNGGYPKKLMKVAISCGSKNGASQGNAPGGNTGWHRFNLDPIIPALGVTLLSPFPSNTFINGNSSCFVPVISAIDLNSSILPSTNGGLFYDVNSSLATNPHIFKVNNLFYNLSPPNVSPFDIMYVAPSNQVHGESNSEWQGLFDNAITAENLYLQNQNITNDRTYHARNQITVGSNVTTTIPQGDFTIKAGTNVKMTAGNSIVLLPGFTAEAGSEFTASTHTETSCIIRSVKSTRLRLPDLTNFFWFKKSLRCYEK